MVFTVQKSEYYDDIIHSNISNIGNGNSYADTALRIMRLSAPTHDCVEDGRKQRCIT